MAKFLVGPSRFLLCSCSPYLVLALANTSAFCPASTWAASWSVPLKLLTTFQPGCCCEKVVASSVNAPVSDAAASTVRVPPLRVEPPLELDELLPHPAANPTRRHAVRKPLPR